MKVYGACFRTTYEVCELVLDNARFIMMTGQAFNCDQRLSAGGINVDATNGKSSRQLMVTENSIFVSTNPGGDYLDVLIAFKCEDNATVLNGSFRPVSHDAGIASLAIGVPPNGTIPGWSSPGNGADNPKAFSIPIQAAWGRNAYPGE